ncbi:MAG: hypothetical protein ABIH00_09605, partial [Armatimonadota bacterium]
MSDKIKNMILDFIREAGVYIQNLTVRIRDHLGEKKFRKAVYLLFCIFLVIFSYYATKSVMAGNITKQIIAVILLICFFYLVEHPTSLFYLLIFCLPFTEFPMGGRFDALNMANALYGFLLIATVFGAVIKNNLKIPGTYLDWPILITIGVFFFSIIQTGNIGRVDYIIKGSFINAPYFRTVFQVILFAFIASSFYMTVAKLKDKESIKKAVRVWLWSSAFIAFLGLYGYFGIKLGLP